MRCLPCPAAPVNQTFPFVVADWMSRILITEVDLLRENGNQIKNVCLEYKKIYFPCTSGTCLYCKKDGCVLVIIKDKNKY